MSDRGTAPSMHTSARAVAAVWAPLALSWAMMGVEQPAIAAVIARLPQPEVSLAAYGGVVFPIALVIEAPIIMLLSASTELSRDRASYRALQGFAHRAGATLTLLHLLVAATPFYAWLVTQVFAVPATVAHEARLGLLLMLPWTWSIAWRRTGQGVLIRFGRSRLVGIGTVFRVLATGLCLGVGLWRPWASGVVVGASALSMGVMAEAAFVAIAVRGCVHAELSHDDPAVTPLLGRAFWAFYLPLASMPIVSLAIQPIGTAAIGRMPWVLESLAVWPVVSSLLFFLQAPGLALAEVVVAELARAESRAALRRFVRILCVALTVVVLLFAITPLSAWWFREVIGLRPELADTAEIAFWLGAPAPVLRALQSWYQGRLVAARRTRGVSEAVFIFGAVCIATFVLGAASQRWSGVLVTAAGFSLGRGAQTFWIAWRARQNTPP